MNSLKTIFLFLLLLLPTNWCQELTDKNIENERNCRERNRLITTDDGDIYMLVDVVPGENLILECHYCKENDDEQPKVWYRIDKLKKSGAQEVKLGMESNTSFNRIHINTEHALVIGSVTVNDTGFYYCIGLEGQEAQNKYNYFVDTVFGNETKPETGNLTAWRKYHDENFVPINKVFKNSGNSEYVYIREQLFIQMEVVTEWEPWGPCEICGRPQGDGRRRKKGFCRLKLTQLAHDPNKTIVPRNNEEMFLLGIYQISCLSLAMYSTFPAISNITKFLPHFIQQEQCEGSCNPDAEGLSKGWKTGKSLGFKYKKSYVLAQDAHLTLVCPESTLENVVRWRKNGKSLNPGESVQPFEKDAEPRITVDTFNTLYLHGVTSEEEGNYTCEVDTIRMQQIRVYVVSKSRLLTQAFVRHVMYLAFVLSLTLTCYCAGLFITWKRKYTFKGYEELVEIEQKKIPAKDTDSDVSDYV